MIKGTWAEPLVWWAYTAVAVTCVLGITYAAVQQVYRTDLDDPQIQMAEDGALTIAKGGVPADVVPHGTALEDMQASLAPWVAVFDQNGTPLESSATLNNAPPQLPKGVFDISTWSKAPMFLQNGMQETRFSWQPQPDVRQAVVLVKVQNGMYVASGRNMRDVEQRIEHEGELIFAGWVVTLGALLLASYIGWWLLTKKKTLV
jgi:hypothetical protein